MAEEQDLGAAGQRETAEAAPPGIVSRLLLEIAQTPEEDFAASWREALRPGAIVGRYQIRNEIGRGGFGAVYEAFDPELGRTVALKALKPGRKKHQLLEEWIKKEAEAVAKLDHAAIVTLFDVGTCASGAYLVMELLHGETLDHRIERGALPVDEALRIAEEMARGLAHAHSRGVLHRDLKPANVFLCQDGRVKLLDFGLAHLLGTDGASGAGTPAYMAPEQAAGVAVDERADVYAAGMVLGEMLTGKRPVAPSTPPAAAPATPSPETESMWPAGQVAVAGPAPSAQPELPGVPRPLAKAISLALATAPSTRPRDGATWLAALGAARASLERPVRARRVALLASVGVLVGLAIAGFATWRIWERQIPGGRPTVAVADFANETGDKELDSLSGLLITALEQSTQLRILTRGRMFDVLKQLGRGEVERIDEPLAREVGRETRARALLLGSIRKLGDSYVVEMRALDPLHDEYLFTVSDRASGKEAVFDLVDRVAASARRALREDPDEVRATRVRLGEAVTSSLAAYEHYFRGEQLAADGRSQEALEAYRRALEIDPSFAMAHLSIARVLATVDQAQSNAALSRALQNVDRVPEKERLLIRAWDAGIRYRTEAALALLQDMQDRWPQDPDGYALAAQFLYWQRGDPERVAALYQMAAALDPSRYPTAIKAQIHAGRLDGALGIAKRFADQRPGPLALRFLTLVHSFRGEEASALAAARGALRAGSPLTDELLHALLRGGALAEADDIVRRNMADPSPEMDRRDAYINKAVLLAVRGRQRDALTTLDAAAREVDGGKPSTQLRWTRTFLRGGTRDVARIAAEAREQFDAGESSFICEAAMVADLGDPAGAEKLLAEATPELLQTPCGRMTRGVILWRRGDVAGALAELESIEYGADRFYLGKVLLDAHRDGEAVAAFRSFGNRTSGWLTFFAWAYPQSLFHTAVALDRLGQVAEAGALLDRLLTLWNDADPDLPLLAEAKGMQARLAMAK